jgi:hypothetical protein
MRMLGLVVLTPLLAFLLTAGSTRTVDSSPPPVQVRPQAVVWANLVFTRRTPLASWLEAHDRSYAEWARKHGHAARRLAGPSS